eukprot:scaffold129196_cov19-Tisochrysis_lutea.AAC.4
MGPSPAGLRRALTAPRRTKIYNQLQKQSLSAHGIPPLCCAAQGPPGVATLGTAGQQLLQHSVMQ